jgi:hypothetical protein
MQLLNRSSLYKTVDNVNEALFYGKKITKTEAKNVINWMSSRYDTEYSYNRSFGLTGKDMNSGIYTYTGERLVSASMRHIMAEESARVVLQLSRITGSKPNTLESTDERFYKMLEASKSAGKPIGTFCCGACTIGLWRYLNAGGLPKYQKYISDGILSLHSNRDETGKWGRFPFYYTLLALSEIDDPSALKEINYAMPECERALKRLKPESKFSKRKRDLLLKIMN